MKWSNEVADRIIEGFAIGFVGMAVIGVCFAGGWMIGSLLHSVLTW